MCIPVMLTSRKRQDILDDIESCERRGIVVYTQDDLEPLVLNTLGVPRSELRIAEVRQRLENAVARVKEEELSRINMVRDVEDLKKSLGAFSQIKDDQD